MDALILKGVRLDQNKVGENHQAHAYLHMASRRTSTYDVEKARTCQLS